MERSSEAFRNNPLFLRNQFRSDGTTGMPVIRKQKIDLTDAGFIGYDQIRSDDKHNTGKYVHFFLDDYKFEVLWSDPKPRLEKLSQYKGVLSPQFSTYYTMPVALQIYNTFRSRWCGAYFQSKGLTVIPTVSWGLPESYWYCFDGIEKGSVVAVSTLGVRKEKRFFMQGYNEMMERIEPKAILCYSTPFEEMQGNVIQIGYTRSHPVQTTKGFYVHKTTLSDSITAGMGGGGTRFPKPQDSGDSTSIIYQTDPSALPENAQRSYEQYQKNNWSGTYEGQNAGTKAGGKWHNKPPQLPEFDVSGNPLSYREFDVNSRIPGQLRDTERFVRDNNGTTYYSPDHYRSFYLIKEG